MKKFIIKIVLFLAPLIVLSFFLDRCVSENLKKSTTHAEGEYPTWNAIFEGDLNADIFIYGSSRAWVHFDPKIIEDVLAKSTYNLGIDGLTFNMQYLRHVTALKYNPKPKMIIHSLDIGTLQKGNLYNPDQFLPYMLWNKQFYEYMSRYEGYSYFDFHIPFIRYYGKLQAIKTALKMQVLPQSNEVRRVKGYEGFDWSWNNDFDEAKKTMTSYVARPDTLSYHLFDKYLQTSKKQGILVVLVYSPYYIEGQKYIKNQAEIIEMYAMFARKYDCMFLDFSGDEICFDKKYFYNASHMNKTGAELFTRKLCKRINSELKNKKF